MPSNATAAGEERVPHQSALRGQRRREIPARMATARPKKATYSLAMGVRALHGGPVIISRPLGRARVFRTR